MWRKHVRAAMNLVLSPGVYERGRDELRAIGCRARCTSPANLLAIRRAREASPLRLIIGAGTHRVEGWVSVDLFCDADVRWDLRWPLPFATGSVQRIHCEHFLEHLEVADAQRLLAEMARVLKADGDLRLIVPDAEKYMRAYVARDRSFFEPLVRLGGAQVPMRTRAEIVNHSFRMNEGHRFAYDAETLGLMLVEAGLRHWRIDAHAPERQVDLGDSWRMLESLYLRASKAPLEAAPTPFEAMPLGSYAS